MLRHLPTRLRNLLEHVRASFWFIPSLMVFAALVVFFVLQAVDQANPELDILFFGKLPPVGAEGGRALLSTIAASMITVAGTVFSITIVVLVLASSQFGPRLLRNFISSPSNQVVLGSFISSFVYCLMVLASIQPEGDTSFVPQLSIFFANLLAILNVGVLIYFIHYIATSIQADHVIHNVSEELMSQLDTLLIDYGAQEITTGSQTQRDDALSHETPVTSCAWGYIQAINFERLLNLAIEHDCLLEMKQKPGNYVTTDETLVYVLTRQEADEALKNRIHTAFIIGHSRSPEQDVEFAIRQLVEVAVRALSPGINDPNTALTCLDQLGTALSITVQREFPDSEIGDSNGTQRLLVQPLTFTGIIDSSFNQIRQHGKGNAAILIRMVEVMTKVAGSTTDRKILQDLQRHTDLVERAARRSIAEESDLEDLQKRVETFEAALNEPSKSV